jgi:hypothetical protein
MNSAVYLDNQLCLEASKVRNAPANRVLPSKTPSQQRIGAETSPESSLSSCHSLPQILGE